MRFICSCGVEFDNFMDLANHKKIHQVAREKPQGVICLGCGQGIPIESDKADYHGPLTCPHCHRTMTVTLSGGEVVVARLG